MTYHEGYKDGRITALVDLVDSLYQAIPSDKDAEYYKGFAQALSVIIDFKIEEQKTWRSV